MILSELLISELRYILSGFPGVLGMAPKWTTDIHRDNCPIPSLTPDQVLLLLA